SMSPRRADGRAAGRRAYSGSSDPPPARTPTRRTARACRRRRQCAAAPSARCARVQWCRRRVSRACVRCSWGYISEGRTYHGRCFHSEPLDHARPSSAARRNMTSSTPNSTAAGHASYDPGAIEQKWQERWRAERTNSPDLTGAERPYYQLMMFPYPSAEGLHIGNVFAFTGNDIHGRFQRLQGHTVFEPIGFDAFGIHSENYALKVGIHPMELIPRNIANFRRQLRRVGLMVDWSHELSTTDPAYYKWTQWIFLQLLERGLAYRGKAAVNWCPSCKTVLANEQVVNGACERCGTPVEQRFLEQWFFRITEYAPRLLANLDWIDWSDTTKTAQRNWIGKSEGAEIEFAVAGSDASIRVFTTRPDTIFGATYVVLAP